MIPQYKYAIYGCNYVAKHTTWLIDYTGRIYPCAIMWQNSIHGNPIAKMQSRSIFSVQLGNSVSLSHNHTLSSNFKEFNITASSDNDKFFMNIELMLVIYIYMNKIWGYLQCSVHDTCIQNYVANSSTGNQEGSWWGTISQQGAGIMGYIIQLYIMNVSFSDKLGPLLLTLFNFNHSMDWISNYIHPL